MDWLQPMVDNLLRNDTGVVAAAVLKHAAEHKRAELDDGVLVVEIPLDHPHWDLIPNTNIRQQLLVAGHAQGVTGVQFVMRAEA